MLGRYRLRVQLEQTSVDTEVVQVLLGLEMDKYICELEWDIFLLVLFHFLGPRGPLVLPLVGPSVRKKNLDRLYTGLYAL